MDYQINVTATGTYQVDYRVAAQNASGGSIQLQLNGSTIGSISIPSTGGWQTYITVSNEVQLIAGDNTLRIFGQQAGWNLNWIEFSSSNNNNNGQSFTPDPNKTYYLDVPAHNLRLAATGQSQDAYTTSTNTTGADVEWRFVAKGNGFWHLRRAAGGALPGLRTDNTVNADMQDTNSVGINTYYRFDHGNDSGTHYITLPDVTSNFQRLQMNPQGDVLFTSIQSMGTWVSWNITEATQATLHQACGYTGTSIALGIGEYPSIENVGFANNQISSLRIPEGLQVTLFNNDNFEGSSIVLTTDDNCLVNNSFNDITSSLIIEPIVLGTRALHSKLSVTPIFGQKAKLQWHFLQNDTKKVRQYNIMHSSSVEEEMKKVTTIPAEEIEGVKSYEYIHDNPELGINYYQVIIQYEDESKNYQLVGDATFQEKVGLVQISPNPTDGNLFIDLSRYMDKSVYYFVNSIEGKQVLEGTWDEKHEETVELNLENIQNGLYVLYVKPDNGRATALKFVVSKDY